MGKSVDDSGQARTDDEARCGHPRLKSKRQPGAAPNRVYAVRWTEALRGEKPDCHLKRYGLHVLHMIQSSRHRGLEKFFTRGSKAGIQAQHEKRLKLILGRLHASTTPLDMNLPGLRLHELTGKQKGTWSVSVSGNWRITFLFEGEDAVLVDYEDYH
jgi:proteic killer suppression protein